MRLVTSGGDIEAQYSYTPYGVATKLAGSGPDADFQYTGYYAHQRSGLYLTVSRAYGSWFGHFINRDPVGEAGGENLYRYALNDPVSFIDPSGNGPMGTAVGGAWGALAGGVGAGLAGAAGGTLAVPGVGTIAGAYEGALAGAAGGAVVGASWGNALEDFVNKMSSQNSSKGGSRAGARGRVWQSKRCDGEELKCFRKCSSTLPNYPSGCRDQFDRCVDECMYEAGCPHKNDYKGGGWNKDYTEWVGY